jgi:hypothetical protein
MQYSSNYSALRRNISDKVFLRRRRICSAVQACGTSGAGWICPVTEALATVPLRAAEGDVVTEQEGIEGK